MVKRRSRAVRGRRKQNGKEAVVESDNTLTSKKPLHQHAQRRDSASATKSHVVARLHHQHTSEDGAEHFEDHGFPLFNPTSFRPYSLATYKQDWRQIKNEVLAGIVVGFAKVPEAIAFAFLAGIPPLYGLHAAWIIGLLSGLFLARPGLISCATGVAAAVIRAPIEQYGLGYLYWIVMLNGILLVLFGVLRLAKFVRLLSVPVMMGFTNGLAIIIGYAQLHSFQVSKYQYPDSNQEWIWEYLGAGTFILMIALVLVTAAVVQFLPRLTKMVPSSFVALVLGIILEQIYRAASDGAWQTPLIGEVVEISSGLPLPFFLHDGVEHPAFSFELLGRSECESEFSPLVNMPRARNC